MGFFSKLKENFTHGGVKISLQAPPSVSMNGADVPVTVALSATDKQESIERVTVRILAQTNNRAFSASSNANANASQNEEHTVAEAEYAQPFSLAPGETKNVPLNIVMNQGAAVASQLPQDSGAAKVFGALQKLESVSEAMNGASYTYTIEASAKVQGLALGPGTRQPIQILKPGQIGTGIAANVHL